MNSLRFSANMATPTPTPSPLAPPQWVFQWSEIVAGLGSVVLTILLVVLYKRQQEQLAAQHEAVLEVTGVDWEGDRATVYISNFGNGVAKRLRLATLVQVDTGDHRYYTIRSNVMERMDKKESIPDDMQQQWGNALFDRGGRPNAIQPEEEDIPFEGKSRVGKPAPINFKGEWIGRDFSDFIRDVKKEGSTEVKYLHAVVGNQLSNRRVAEPIYMTTRSVNPQDFVRKHSLENLPGVTEHGYDHTFDHYFRSTWWSWFKDWIYFTRVRFLNWLLRGRGPRVRPLDASGKKRVKRVLLRQDVSYFLRRIKNRIPIVQDRF
jgi:hypothetical protein